jgi:hypothetical protein
MINIFFGKFLYIGCRDIKENIFFLLLVIFHTQIFSKSSLNTRPGKRTIHMSLHQVRPQVLIYLLYFGGVMLHV